VNGTGDIQQSIVKLNPMQGNITVSHVIVCLAYQFITDFLTTKSKISCVLASTIHYSISTSNKCYKNLSIEMWYL